MMTAAVAVWPWLALIAGVTMVGLGVDVGFQEVTGRPLPVRQRVQVLLGILVAAVAVVGLGGLFR